MSEVRDLLRVDGSMPFATPRRDLGLLVGEWASGSRGEWAPGGSQPASGPELRLSMRVYTRERLHSKGAACTGHTGTYLCPLANGVTQDPQCGLLLRRAMIQHRELLASKANRSLQFWSRIMLAIARLIVPALRLVLRAFPAAARAARRHPGSMQGSIFQARDRGDHRAAFSAAMEGVAFSNQGVTASSIGPGQDFYFWTFLDLAAQEAQHLSEEERRRVEGFLEEAPAPGGMLAASCLRCISGWRWKEGDREGAIKLAKEAVLADPSWPHSHILLGWFGLVSGRFDPLPTLRAALQADPSCAQEIRANRDFAGAKNLLRALGLAET